MELRTTKRKFWGSFYAKRESVMRLPKHTTLNQIDWLRSSTSPSGTGTLYAYRCKLDSKALALCCTLCSDQKDYFLKLTLIATKFWTYTANLITYHELRTFREQVSVYIEKLDFRSLPIRGTMSLKFFGTYSSKT